MRALDAQGAASGLEIEPPRITVELEQAEPAEVEEE